ncbi:MAG: hypothetical protein ACE5GU_14680 [Candidatus Scalinduaceae bacterium]
MATCKYCEKSSWFLRLTSDGLCESCDRILGLQVRRAVQIITESDEIIGKSKKLETKLSRLELIENTVKNYLLPIERKGIKAASQSPDEVLDKVAIMREEIIINTLQEYLNKAKDKAEKAKSAKSKINAYSKALQKITELKNKVSNPDIISNFESKVKQLLDNIQPNAFSDATKTAEKQKIKERELNQKRVTPEVIWQQGIDDYRKEQLRLEKILRDVESKSRDVLIDFEWPEFDKFCKLFKESGEWPHLWDTIAKYTYLQECSIEELLNELTKKQLFETADKYSANVKKNYKKEKIIEVLIGTISENDKDKLLEIVNQEWKPKFLDTKRYLLEDALDSYYPKLTGIKELFYEENEAGAHIKQIEIDAAGFNDCSICSDMHGKKFKVKSLDKKNIPPFHPGCRCVILPVIE